MTASRQCRLSRQQREILLHLYRETIERREVPFAATEAVWGVPWHTTGTRSERASISRALARLEERGLIIRQNWCSGSPVTGQARQTAAEPHNRTTNVLLLPAGVEVAQQLTKKVGAEC